MAIRNNIGPLMLGALFFVGTPADWACADNPKQSALRDKQLFQTDVWTAGRDGYHTYRIPALIVTKKGSLLAFCEGRKDNARDHGDIDLLIKRSENGGSTWSKHAIVWEEGGDKKITIGNPCPVVDQSTGVLWMPFTRDNTDVFVTHSKDDGRTWAAPINITKSVSKKKWGWYATGPGVGIQLTVGKHKGRMVIPCDHRFGNPKVRVPPTMSHVFYSDDHGKTWKLGGTVGHHTNECQVVERNNGDLLINMRNLWGRDGKDKSKGRMRAIAISKDGGDTWGKIGFDRTLIEPVCQASLIRYSSVATKDTPNEVILFSNPASRTRREKLTVRMSIDGGRTWKHERALTDGPAAYSCLARLPDGSIGCLYEGGARRYGKIRFARFTIRWLLGK